MKYCSSCGQELMDAAVICPKCGCGCGNNGYRGLDPHDAPDTGAAVLGFFIPIVGLILYLVNINTKPQYAKSAGKGALIAVIVSIALWIVYAVVIALLAAGGFY